MKAHDVASAGYIVHRGWRRGPWTLLLLLGLMQGLADAVEPPAAPPQAKPAEGPDADSSFDVWKSFYLGQSRIGYGHQTCSTRLRDRTPIVVSESLEVQAMTRFGETILARYLVYAEELPDGQLQKVAFELQNAGAAPVRVSGRAVRGQLELDIETNGTSRKKVIPLDQAVRGPLYPERSLRERPLAPGQRRTLKVFDPVFQEIVTYQYRARDWVGVKLPQGEERSLLPVDVQHSLLESLRVTMFVDNQGQVWKQTANLLDMAVYQVPKTEALKSIEVTGFDFGLATLIQTDPLERPAATREVVYRISASGEDVRTLFPTGPTQSVRVISEDAIEVTVKSIVPAASAPATPPPTGGPTAADTQPNSLIQSNDRLVQELAAQAVAGESDRWKAAQKLERWVQANLKQKGMTTLLASAAEVAKTLSGDCTEAAVLLAAMARSQNIPARVAIGLVYVPQRESFGGHMWTEVYIEGVWVSLDGTQGLGRVGADHIKLSHTNLTDLASALSPVAPLLTLLPRLEIRIVSVR